MMRLAKPSTRSASCWASRIPADRRSIRHAADGDPRAFAFPRSMLDSGDFDFSFSGLKTSVRYRLAELDPACRREWLPDMCASFQEAVVEVLVAKTLRQAARSLGVGLVAVGGGVACNRRLRGALESACGEAGLGLRLVSPAMATDNAAMIAEVARHRFRKQVGTPFDEDIDPNLPMPGLACLRGARSRPSPQDCCIALCEMRN